MSSCFHVSCTTNHILSACLPPCPSLTQLRETGVVDKFANAWLPKPADCQDTHRSLKPATLANVMTAFLQLGVALVLSLVILAVERGWWRWGQTGRVITTRTIHDSTSELRGGGHRTYEYNEGYYCW